MKISLSPATLPTPPRLQPTRHRPAPLPPSNLISFSVPSTLWKTPWLWCVFAKSSPESSETNLGFSFFLLVLWVDACICHHNQTVCSTVNISAVELNNALKVVEDILRNFGEVSLTPMTSRCFIYISFLHLFSIHDKVICVCVVAFDLLWMRERLANFIWQP